ncbi:hypothetical protein GCM10007905_20910 [Mixta theicola]|nr:hypothetical protein GCM10007905_20910 [Mixta theicola]
MQVQSLNDFVVFGVMIVGSFVSGALLNLYGWNAMLWGSLILVYYRRLCTQHCLYTEVSFFLIRMPYASSYPLPPWQAKSGRYRHLVSAAGAVLLVELE